MADLSKAVYALPSCNSTLVVIDTYLNSKSYFPSTFHQCDATYAFESPDHKNGSGEVASSGVGVLPSRSTFFRTPVNAELLVFAYNGFAPSETQPGPS